MRKFLPQCFQTDWTNTQCLYPWAASGFWGQHRTWQCSTEGRRWSVSSLHLRTQTSWAPFSPCCITSVTCRYHLGPAVYLSCSPVNILRTNTPCLCISDSFAQDGSLLHQCGELAEPVQGQNDRQTELQPVQTYNLFTVLTKHSLCLCQTISSAVFIRDKVCRLPQSIQLFHDFREGSSDDLPYIASLISRTVRCTHSSAHSCGLIRCVFVILIFPLNFWFGRCRWILNPAWLRTDSPPNQMFTQKLTRVSVLW